MNFGIALYLVINLLGAPQALLCFIRIRDFEHAKQFIEGNDAGDRGRFTPGRR